MGCHRRVCVVLGEDSSVVEVWIQLTMQSTIGNGLSIAIGCQNEA